MGKSNSREQERGIYHDCHRAIFNPPTSALEREVLFARIRTYSVRIQYISWNIAATVLLYLFPDSLLNQYIIHDKIYYNIIFHALQFIAIFTYFLTSFLDPGYVPLPKHNEILSPDDDRDNRERRETEELNKKRRNMVKNKPWNKNIVIDPDQAPSNFCWRCKFVRPIRSKHCYDCDRCVAKFDHHCPMVGNCVGGQNHRFFLLFMLTQTVVVVWAFYMSLNTLFKMDLLYSYRNSQFIDESTDDRTVAGWIFRILFFICMFFALFVVVGLSGFHCYLASTNQTTYEMIKPQVAEKWRDEEEKRKKTYQRKEKKKKKKLQKNKADDEKGGGDIDNDNVDDSEDDDNNKRHPGTPGPNGRKRRSFHSEPVSFDKGFISNIAMFWGADLRDDWKMPLPCQLKDSDTEESE